MTAGRSARALIASAALLAAAGCGGGDGGEKDSDKQAEGALASSAADLSTCKADATALSPPYAEDFPEAWTFPPDTAVYHVEHRGTTGTIVTGVSSAPFGTILDFLNKDAVAAGFTVTEGETEEDDAEANWTSEGFTGRWTIRKSADCPGETVIQVLATPA